MKFRTGNVLLFVVLLSTVPMLTLAPSSVSMSIFDQTDVVRSSVEQSAQPKVVIAPEIITKWAVDETFEADVLVENVSGMRGIYFEIYWDSFYDPRVPDWSPVLNTSGPEIKVYEDVLPKPYKAYGLTVVNGSERSWMKFLCILDCATAPQNGTAKIMSMNFTVLDPWSCGRQPAYTRNEDKCGWIPGNATSKIVMWWGYSILQYPSLHYVYFGKFFGQTEGVQGYAMYGDAAFTFMPVPGDLDGNGKADAGDIMIISQFYNSSVAEYPNSYYDLNRDGVIDIYDIVIVTSNYGRTSPF